MHKLTNKDLRRLRLIASNDQAKCAELGFDGTDTTWLVEKLEAALDEIGRLQTYIESKESNVGRPASHVCRHGIDQYGFCPECAAIY